MKSNKKPDKTVKITLTLKQFSGILILICCMCLVLPLAAFGTEATALYVSPTGSNNNSGSQSAPFKTIQYGLDRLSPGQTLYVQTGIYREKLRFNRSGSKGKSIQLRAAAGAKPIIDGTLSSGQPIEGYALIDLNGNSFVRIEGFELRNNIEELFPSAILVDDGASHIEILSNKIHDINTLAVPGSGEEGGASAILIEGTHPTIASTEIVIRGNEVYDCELGYSEAISISKNVDGFIVENNTVRNVSNIGIDAAGFHGSFEGLEALNQARNGQIIGNTVSGARSKYGTGNASGIYIDGAQNITVANNKTFDNDNGITIGCENKGHFASHIVVKNNYIWNNDKSGLSVGGWSKDAGRVSNVSLYNNLTYKNNRLGLVYHAELNLKLTEGPVEIYNNIFYSRQTKATTLAGEKVLYPLLYNLEANGQTLMKRNLWYAQVQTKDAYFRYNDKPYMGIQKLIEATGLEAYGLFTKPVFSNPDSGDFKQMPLSTALDFGPSSAAAFGIYKTDGKLNEWFPISTNLDTLPKPLVKGEFDGRSLWFGIKKGSSQAKTQIFIDSDQNQNTGYKHYKIANYGAEYMIEDATLYRYTGTSSQWSWQKISLLNYASNGLVKELQLPLSHLLISSSGQLSFAYIEKDPATNKYDHLLLGIIRIVLN